jgi:hypothetical protein
MPDVLDVRPQHRLRLTLSGTTPLTDSSFPFEAGRPSAAGNQVHRKTKRTLPHGAS